MYARNHRIQRGLWGVAVLVLLLASACGPSDADATPTQSVDQIYTAAAQTISAQQLTQLALTPPTSTPSPTATITLPPPSPLATFAFATATKGLGGGGSSACDDAWYVADVTVPDNTIVEPGKKFTKTWRLLNKGSCNWTTDYKLVFDSGDQMGGTTGAVKVPVPSGSIVDVSVELTAPTNNGTYKGNWRMQNSTGQNFGNIIYVQIKVGAGATVTAGPSPTGGVGSFTISGSLNVQEVTLEFSGATSIPVVTFTTDGYSFSVPSGWSGTIVPSKGNPGHWTFDPSSKTFTNVTKDMTQNFTGIPVTPTSP